MHSTLRFCIGRFGLRHTPSATYKGRPVCGWWRDDEWDDWQGGGIDGLNGPPGRVSLWLLAVGVANHFTLTSLTLDSPASGRVQLTGACMHGTRRKFLSIGACSHVTDVAGLQFRVFWGHSSDAWNASINR